MLLQRNANNKNLAAMLCWLAKGIIFFSGQRSLLEEKGRNLENCKKKKKSNTFKFEKLSERGKEG